MKRKIELYIAGQKADLADENLVLYNYSFTELSKPTAVKNSFSKQVSLPPTPANASIFGHFGRVDRLTSGAGGVGAGFNAGQKTQFLLLADTGEVIESGYIRLDSVTKKAGIITGYKISLFGGLGAFIYALSYDANGNKRTLADLDYLGEGARELDFTINATTVHNAWSRIAAHDPGDGVENIWDVINFAPAYNGYPDGDFTADKGFGRAAGIGLPTSKEVDGVTYTPKDDNVIISLAGKKTEWEVKDLRSYLQRPVLSMWAFLQAIADTGNNGGYTVDLSSINEAVFKRMYKTLPMIPSLSSASKALGTLSAAYTGVIATSGRNVGNITYDGSGVQSGSTFRYGVTPVLQITMPIHTEETLSLRSITLNQSLKVFTTGLTFIFVQLVGVDSGNVVVGGSKVACIGPSMPNWYTGEAFTPKSVADVCGYSPSFVGAGFEDALTLRQDATRVLVSGNYVYEITAPKMECEAIGADHFELRIAAYHCIGNTPAKTKTIYLPDGTVFYEVNEPDGTMEIIYTTGGNALAYLYDETNATSMRAIAATSDTTALSREVVSYTLPSSLRTGARITKQMLLSSDKTPAEYLISLAKMYGLVFTYDVASKKVSILKRNDFFVDETIDLTDRVDRAQEISIIPQVFSSKWYNFAQEVAEGAWPTQYKSIYGLLYGIQKVNTGYDFDAAEVNLLDGCAYKGAATILDHGPYWNTILLGGACVPSVFIDTGVTYTMWAADNSSMDFPVSQPDDTAVIGYYNEHGHEGYDEEFSPKLDLRDKEGKSVDGTDILCFYTASTVYPYFKVSDDSSAMYALNGGKPCWFVQPGRAEGISVPVFNRYNDYFETWKVTRSLDFGIPKELDIPYLVFDDNGSMYLAYWRNYMLDLMDKDTKVMKCRVDFSGLQVGQSLLRKFYYYDGCIWVLNKISNYSVTTYDAVECEFVKVKDKNNYLTGQNW